MIDLSNDNVIHVKNNGIEYIQFRRLLEYKDKLTHCYTLKPIDIKGKSKEDEDFKKICKALDIDYNNIIMPKQTHTDRVEIVYSSSQSGDFSEVDGLITKEKNKAITASFADCTSLFLYDPVKNVIGNIHSGWRGTVKKIGEVAVGKMVEGYGSNPSDLICCIGPTIRKCHFEVEDDVKEIYENVFNDSEIIEKTNPVNGVNKYHIDSVKAIINTLKNCGLKSENIVDSGICTVCNNEVLHSYRSEGSMAGRNASIMCLI